MALAGGAWAMVTYLAPPHPPESSKIVCAQQGVAIGGNVSGGTITNAVSGATIAAPCAETKK
jgi:hypothetical protein